jgi:NADH dehydrogenase
MRARIYQPARSAMTSGEGNTRRWVLEYSPELPRGIEPLMGWTSSADMNSQVRLRFDTKLAAIDYAERNGIPYVVQEAKRRRPNVRPRGYGGNFAHDRRTGWTH